MADEKKHAERETARTATPSNSQNPHKQTGSRDTHASNKAEKPSRGSLTTRRLLPICSIVLAFVSMVLLYRWVFPPAEPEPVAEEAAPVASEEPVMDDAVAQGVEDPWTASGTFSMGNQDLDIQIKEFCDALSMDGYTAAQNAETVYDAIVWSAYEEREQDQKPAGNDWDVALMRNFFSTGNPALGQGGAGDVYDYAATSSYCLRYFGFSDALAVPVLRTNDYGVQESSALVLVTGPDGSACVCDPSLSGEGWMLDRSSYDIVVENLGQDLTEVKNLGLTVKESPKPTSLPDQGDNEGESSSPYSLDDLKSMYEQNNARSNSNQEADDEQDESDQDEYDSEGQDESEESEEYDSDYDSSYEEDSYDDTDYSDEIQYDLESSYESY